MFGKIITALAAAALLASTGLASAQDQIQASRLRQQQPRYYNMVPNNPAPAPTVPDNYNYWSGGNDYSGYNGGTGVSGQAKGL